MPDSTTPSPTVTNYDLLVGTHSHARAAMSARVKWWEDALDFWQRQYCDDGEESTLEIMRQMEHGLSITQLRQLDPLSLSKVIERPIRYLSGQESEPPPTR